MLLLLFSSCVADCELMSCESVHNAHERLTMLSVGDKTDGQRSLKGIALTSASSGSTGEFDCRREIILSV